MLADDPRHRYVTETMSRLPSSRVGVLVLTLIVALGISLSFVQSGLMAAGMAVAADHGSVPCPDCGGGDDGAPDAGTCIAVCGSLSHALPVGGPAAPSETFRLAFQAGDLIRNGRSQRPDHGPPKLSTLG